MIPYAEHRIIKVIFAGLVHTYLSPELRGFLLLYAFLFLCAINDFARRKIPHVLVVSIQHSFVDDFFC